MINISFQAVILATVQIMLMGLIGFISYRRKVIDDGGLTLFTKLLINLFLPCFIFFKLITYLATNQIENGWMFPLINFGFILAGVILSSILFLFRKDLKAKKQFMALVSFQNSGYIPLLLVATIFDGKQEQALFIYIFLLIVGFSTAIWSFGVWLIAGNKIKDLKLRTVITPPLITTAVSLALVAIGWSRFVPQTILQPVKMFGDCAMPIAMIVIGGNLARIPIRDIKKEVVLALFFKMFLMPIVAFFVVMIWKPGFLIAFLIMLEAVMPSAVTLSIISRYYKNEEEMINQGIFYSHLISIITVPLFLSLFVNYYNLF